MNLERMSELELLRAHGAVIDELSRRSVVSTRNNPIGDYTEWMVCKRLGLERQNNSKAHFDALDATGNRYQIKARQCEDQRVRFSPIRNLAYNGFDFVVAVAFNRDYSIRFALQISHAAVTRLSTYRIHVNGHILILGSLESEVDGVECITGKLNGDY